MAEGPARQVPLAAWTRYRLAVLVLCAVVLLWRAYSVSRWSWDVDDWVYSSNTASMGFWEYVFQKYNGHLMPAEFVVQWVLTHLAPLKWWPVVVLVSVASAASVWLWSRATAAIAGERVWLVVPQALVALSPLLIHPMSWWASALQVLPMQLCAAWMVIASVRLAASGSRRDLLHLLAGFLVGLAFWEKAVLLVLPALAVLLHQSHGSLRARLRQQLRPVLALAVTSIVYVAAFLVFATTRPDTGRTDIAVRLSAYRSPGEITGFFWRGFADLLAPAVLGGPWGTLPTPATIFDRPPLLVSTLSAAIVLAAAFAAARRVRGWWLPVALVAVYTGVSWGLVLYSARFELQGSSVVNQERYLADGFLMVYLAALLLLTSPRRRPAGPTVSAVGRRRAAGAVGVLLLGSLVVGNVWGLATLGTLPSKPWVENVVSATHREQPVALLDGYAPDRVLPAAYWLDDARLSRMLAPIPGVSFNGPADQLWGVDDDGRLHELDVEASSRSEEGPVADCGYSVEAGASVVAPTTAPLFALDWVVQVDALAAQGGTLTVDLGDRAVTMGVGPGLSQHQFAYRGAVGSTLRLSMSPDSGTVCVIGVSIGNAVPRSD